MRLLEGWVSSLGVLEVCGSLLGVRSLGFLLDGVDVLIGGVSIVLSVLFLSSRHILVVTAL